MSFTFHETPDSRASTENPRSILMKIVAGRTGDDAYMRAYTALNTPLMLDGLFRQDAKLDPQGGGMWEIELPYGPIQPRTPDLSEFRIRFSTTGATARKTNYLSTPTGYARSGETATDHKGAINVQPDGRVEGTEIRIPSFSWTEEHSLPVAWANWQYAQVLKAITGKTNNASFRNLPAGEVLFDGAEGGVSNQKPDQVDLTFHFIQSDSATGLTVGAITSISKGGWQYAWTQHGEEEDTTAKRVASPPIAVYVGDVYEQVNFGALNIGT